MAAQIQTITFTDEGVIINYVEDEEFEKLVPIATQISVPGEPFKADIDDLIDSARHLLDEALVMRRNPPAQFRAPR